MMTVLAALAAAGWFSMLRTATRRSAEIDPPDELAITIVMFTTSIITIAAPAVVIVWAATGALP